jgi:hypothetical protein
LDDTGVCFGADGGQRNGDVWRPCAADVARPAAVAIQPSVVHARSVTLNEMVLLRCYLSELHIYVDSVYLSDLHIYVDITAYGDATYLNHTTRFCFEGVRWFF